MILDQFGRSNSNFTLRALDIMAERGRAMFADMVADTRVRELRQSLGIYKPRIGSIIRIRRPPRYERAKEGQ